MIVWIVGKITEYPAWEFQGVFSSESAAIRACCANEDFFVGPATLDKILPTQSLEWRGAYYPNRVTQVTAAADEDLLPHPLPSDAGQVAA